MQQDCQRCISMTKKGTQCHRTTCITSQKCAQHLDLEDGLAVRPSNIPGAGLGLFTTRSFPAHVIVAKYNLTSAYMAEEDLTRKMDPYLDTSYIWCRDLAEKHCWDARSTQSTIARFANGCDKAATTGKGSKKIKCNAMITRTGDLKTIKRLAKDVEILIPYGPDYWLYQQNL